MYVCFVSQLLRNLICYKYHNTFVNICHSYLVFGMYKTMTYFLIIMSKSYSGVYLNMFTGILSHHSSHPHPHPKPTWFRKINNTKLYLVYITLVYVFLLDVAFVQRFVGGEFTLSLYVLEI